MGKLNILGMDPSFRNWGYVTGSYDVVNEALVLDELELMTTERGKEKNILVTEDDFNCSKLLHRKMVSKADGMNVIFSEIPSGSQSASAARKLGIVTGIMSSTNVPLISLTPTQVKMASVGKRTASKSEMIDWAVETYPELNWLKRKSKGELVLVKKNEHLADAVAVVHAGIQSDRFKQLASMLKGII